MTYKKKAIELAKKIIREKGICEKCGRRKEHGYQMHGSHIFSINASAELAADLDNLQCLCAGCHKMKNDSWHESPLEQWEWFNKKFPGRYERLNKRRQKIVKANEQFWQEKYNNLKKYVRNNN